MPSVLRIKIVSRNAELEVDCQEGTITIEMMALTEKNWCCARTLSGRTTAGPVARTILIGIECECWRLAEDGGVGGVAMEVSDYND